MLFLVTVQGAHLGPLNNQPVRLDGLVRCWFVKKYCWLVWCERKILFRQEIYDRLRQAQANRTG